MTTKTSLKITVKNSGSFDCYVARPIGKTAPVIVIIQEIFGVTKWLQSFANQLAQDGFIAVVPDLFWRLKPGLQLNDNDKKDLEEAFRLYGEYNQDQGVEELIEVVSQARSLEGATGKVGVTGFCLGGLMTYLMAARSNADAFVSYYGGGINHKLNEVPHIKKPLLLHIPGKDEYINLEAQREIKKAIQHKPNISMEVYPNVGHAFARIGGHNYNKDAADLANLRTMEFFKKHLSG
jgi:carboxymethylenebutenolidase